MMCLSQAGFVHKYGQKLTTLGRELGLIATSREELPQLPKIRNWDFCHLFFVGDSLGGLGLERERDWTSQTMQERAGGPNQCEVYCLV